MAVRLPVYGEIFAVRRRGAYAAMGQCAPLDLRQGRPGRGTPPWRHPSLQTFTGNAMKDSTTIKLVLAMSVLAAVAFAVWTGLATSVEAPAQSAQHGAYTTPF
jgi:hypothetical protein